MSTTPSVQDLASKIQQFLSHQIDTNGDLSDASKESLTVAMDCIEQAYNNQRKPASNELMEIYQNYSTSSRAGQQQQQSQADQQQVPDPTQLITNLASTLFSQVGSGFVNAAASAAANLASGQQPQQSQTSPQPSAPSSEQAATSASEPSAQQEASGHQAGKKIRKKATQSEMLAAESFKNQGNDCMKAEKYQEAYNYYTQAIEIDNNNAIYYSNRAAASSKLGNHLAALKDCEEAIEIDPTYSKAYSRMGLSYASMDNHQKAYEYYAKAVQYDPTNETYKHNMAAAERTLAESQGQNPSAPGAGAQNPMGGLNVGNVGNVLRSMMSNPEVMNMAMRSLQDPRIQSMFGLGGGAASPGASGPGGAGNPPSGPGAGTS